MLVASVKTPELPNIFVHLSSVLLEAKFDTISSVSALSATTYYENFFNIPLTQTPLTLRSATNGECAEFSELELMVDLASVTYKQSFVVIQDLPVPSLLGLVMKAHKLPLNFDSHEI